MWVLPQKGRIPLVETHWSVMNMATGWHITILFPGKVAFNTGNLKTSDLKCSQTSDKRKWSTQAALSLNIHQFRGSAMGRGGNAVWEEMVQSVFGAVPLLNWRWWELSAQPPCESYVVPLLLRSRCPPEQAKTWKSKLVAIKYTLSSYCENVKLA